MKLSPNWIRDFVDLTVDDRRLAEDLTAVGIAVEGIGCSGADTVFEMEIGTNRPDAMITTAWLGRRRRFMTWR
jgi:hypothetical protein